MQLTCPTCHARNSLEACLADDEARQAISSAMKLPANLGDLLLRYIGLFRPAKRALSWTRAAKLLGEILAMIRAAQIRLDGRDWSAPAELWHYALEETMRQRDSGRLELPLRDHNYLLRIIQRRANSAEAQAERKAEEAKIAAAQRRAGEIQQTAEVVDRAAGREHAAQLKHQLTGR